MQLVAADLSSTCSMALLLWFQPQGEIERTEEMLPGFEELAKAKKVCRGKRGGGRRTAMHATAACHRGAGACCCAKLHILLAQISVAPLISKQGGKRKADEEAGATDGEGTAAAAKVRQRGCVCRVPACRPGPSLPAGIVQSTRGMLMLLASFL